MRELGNPSELHFPVHPTNRCMLSIDSCGPLCVRSHAGSNLVTGALNVLLLLTQRLLEGRPLLGSGAAVHVVQLPQPLVEGVAARLTH